MFLWLGLRIVSVGSAAFSDYIMGDSGSVTSKTTKSDAFGDHLSKVLSRCPEDEVVRHCNSVPKDLAMHSYRKYSAEELVTGPDGPNPMAVCDRLNHTLGGEIKKYIKSMPGNDRYCGRICAGLDIYDESFAVLPWRYKNEVLEDPEFQKQLKAVVPNYEKYPICFKVCTLFS